MYEKMIAERDREIAYLKAEKRAYENVLRAHRLPVVRKNGMLMPFVVLTLILVLIFGTGLHKVVSTTTSADAIVSIAKVKAPKVDVEPKKFDVGEALSIDLREHSQNMLTEQFCTYRYMGEREKLLQTIKSVVSEFGYNSEWVAAWGAFIDQQNTLHDCKGISRKNVEHVLNG